MPHSQLKLFIDPNVLSRVQRNSLTRFLQDNQAHLSPDAAALLATSLNSLSFEECCAAWAAQFGSASQFGAPLLHALRAIEFLALPENAPILDDALSHLPPGYEVSRLSRLHQALHLWLIAQNTPGVTWPDRGGGVSSPSDTPSLHHSITPSLSATPPLHPTAPELSRDGLAAPKPSVGGPALPKPCEGGPALPKPSVGGPAAPKPSVGGPALPKPCEGGPALPKPSVGGPAAPKPSVGGPAAPKPCEGGPALPKPCEGGPPSSTPALQYSILPRRSPAEAVTPSSLDPPISAADDAEADAVNLRRLTPWPEPITDAPALFDQVHDRALHYLCLPPGAAVVITVWPAHAHAIKASGHSPRLYFTSSEPGCGKTTALDFIACLCPNVLRSDNLRPAVVFRLAHGHHPTFVLDEIDSHVHLHPELLNLLNAGHYEAGSAFRCEGPNVRAFKAFAATALAGIGDLADTLRDRSIIIPLAKALPGTLHARFNRRQTKFEKTLGQKIARWVQDNFAAIEACEPAMPPECINRLADNWRPLFAIAQVIGGHWPQRVLDAFKHLACQPPVQDPSRLLLSDIRHVFSHSGAQRMFTHELVSALRALAGSRWSGGFNGHKPLNEYRLARHLNALGVRSRNVRIGPTQAKGYERADFAILFGALPSHDSNRSFLAADI